MKNTLSFILSFVVIVGGGWGILFLISLLFPVEQAKTYNTLPQKRKSDTVIYRAKIEVYNPITDTLERKDGVALFIKRKLKRFALFDGAIWADSLFLKPCAITYNIYDDDNWPEDIDLTIKGGQHFIIELVGGKKSMTPNQKEFTKIFSQ